MKYFIRGFFSDWKEVSKEKYESYRTFIENSVVTGKNHVENALQKRTKVEDERGRRVG